MRATNDRIVRLRTVLDRTGLSRSTLYRKIAEGTFPAQLKISVHGAGWRESAVNRWIADPAGYREEVDIPDAIDSSVRECAQKLCT